MANRYSFTNAAQTTLDGNITDSTIVITVTSSTGFPTSPSFPIRIKAESTNADEICLVTSMAGNNWTVTRAAESYAGSALPSAHNSGAIIEHVLTANSMNRIKDKIWTPSANTFSINDEFDDASIDGWTTCEVGGHTATWTESADVISMSHTGTVDTGSGGQYHCKLKALPGGFTYGNYIEAAISTLGVGSSPMTGLIFTDSTTYANTTNYVTAQTWGTSFNAGLRRGKFAATETATTDSGVLTHTGSMTFFIKLTWAGANSWSYAISSDGVSWITLTTQSYTMTPSYLGIAATTWGSANVVHTWQYFRAG